MFHWQKEDRNEDWIFNFYSKLTHHATNNNGITAGLGAKNVAG